MPRRWKCPEDKCNQWVTYERETDSALVGVDKADIGVEREPAVPFPVYLTCDNGHTHRYVVTD